VLRNNYYDRFEDDLEEARKAAIEVSNLCDVYTDVFMKLFDDNIN
jgi:ribosomal protein S17E